MTAIAPGIAAGIAPGIAKVAVIGAGAMGAGIAAQVANAGLPVLLLDVVPEGAKDRNRLAEAALKRLRAARPKPLMSERAARLIRPGNVEDHLDRLAECDWIVEAVVEKLEVKHQVYWRIAGARRPGSIVSSNTSTLPLARLLEGLPQRFRQDFLITHFFNPPRYMRLLEVVAGPDTRAEALETLSAFADRRLGKTVVRCNDTPGFIANRIGAFWIQAAVGAALDQGLSVEEADAVMGPALGFPKSGIFGLLDLVGLDIVAAVDASLAGALPADDPYQAIRRPLPHGERMLAEGYIGRKGRGGFYRLNEAGGQRVKEALDLESGAYRPAVKPRLPQLQAAKASLEALLAGEDRYARYARAVLGRTLAYAASLIPEVTDQPAAADRAMRCGYNWDLGPFEMIDRLGARRLAGLLKAEGIAVPPLLGAAAEQAGFYRTRPDGVAEQIGPGGGYRPVPRAEGVLTLEAVRRAGARWAGNASASLWDLGEGVACLELHARNSVLDLAVLEMVETAVDLVPQRGAKALVIYNDGPNFAFGADLGLLLFAANLALWPRIEQMVERGQRAFRALRGAPFPVVAAPAGLTLGGGCELTMAADAVQAHAESYIGLVEVGAGLVPAWGGCTELLARLAADPKRPQGPMPPVSQAFETIGLAKVSTSAFEARELGFLVATDGITFNRDRLLADARARALELAEGYHPPLPRRLTLPGPSGRAALGLALTALAAKGLASAYDQVVAGALAEVLSGGTADLTEPVSEATTLALERAAFMRLIRKEATLQRIEHLLETGKPLRN